MYNKHLVHNGLKTLPWKHALTRWLQYRRQELVLQCHIRHEPLLLFSYFGTLPMGMLQDIMKSLLNQTHIFFLKCQGCRSSASRRLLSLYRMQSLRKFCNHGSGWLWQELSWLLIHDLTRDILLNPMCLNSNYQVSQTLTVTQLPKHHCWHLISASEMFHISVTTILANIVVN